MIYGARIQAPRPLKAERERERETDREKERQTERQTERERQREFQILIQSGHNQTYYFKKVVL